MYKCLSQRNFGKQDKISITMDNSKRNLGIIIGIVSFTLSMIMGLLGDMRLETMLMRSVVCFAISMMLCFFVIIAIEKFADMDKSIQNGEKTKDIKNEIHNETESKTM